MDWEKIIGVTLFALALAIVVGLGGLAVESITADGRIQYCYIESQIASDMQMWRLYGFRPWRPDRHIGTFTTFEQAVAAAGSLECKVQTK